LQRTIDSSHLTTSITYFFFSSRRRHTRSKRDWSSDVCSSDLVGAHERTTTPTVRSWAPTCSVRPCRCCVPRPRSSVPVWSTGPRSEERRVGKEGRSGWTTACKEKQRKQRENRNIQYNIHGHSR